MTHYKVLGVSPAATPQQIKKARDRLARQYHPDKNTPENAAANLERMKEINLAYECLCDKTKRAVYDHHHFPQRYQPTVTKREEKKPKAKYSAHIDWFLWEAEGIFMADSAPPGVNSKTWRSIFNHKDKEWYYKSLTDLSKDFKNTFKPYKSNFYLQRDMKQPLYALRHLLLALVSLICLPLWPFLAVGLTVYHVIDGKNFEGTLADTIRKPSTGVKLAVCFFSELAAGLIQLTTFPLNYIIRIPLRKYLTEKNKPMLLAERPTIQRLASEFEQALETQNWPALYVIHSVLEKKLDKSLKRGSYHNNVTEESRENFREARRAIEKKPESFFPLDSISLGEPQINSLKNYINFFKPMPSQAQETELHQVKLRCC